jgi:hypothetical protein
MKLSATNLYKNIFSRENRPLLAILIIAFAIYITGLNWGLPQAANAASVNPWALDTVAPVAPLNEAYHKFTRSGNEWVTYPLFHYIVIDTFYTPYLAFQYLTGNFENPSSSFPYGIKDPKSFLQDLTIIARLISLAMAIGIIIIFFKITRELFSRETALWTALFVMLIAPISYYAKTSNLDVPYLFWVSLSVWQYVLLVKYYRLRHFVLFGIFGALAIATKDQAYGFYVLIPLAIIYVVYTKHKVEDNNRYGYLKATVSLPVIYTGLATIITYVLANNLLFGGLDGFLRHMDLGSKLYENRFTIHGNPHSLANQLKLWYESGLIIVQSIGIALPVLSLIGIYLAFKRRLWLALSILIFSISYYLFVIAAWNGVFSRYLLMPLLLLMPFAGYACTRLLEMKKSLRSIGQILIAVSIVWQALLIFDLNYSLLHDSRYSIANWVKQNIPAGATIETQVDQTYLPHLIADYDIQVVGNADTEISAEVDPKLLNAEALSKRRPPYILILKGLGITGDPDTTKDIPALQNYYEALLAGKLGYQVVARFSTPHIIPYRQIPGTRPESILLVRNEASH